MALKTVCQGHESFPFPGWCEEMSKLRHKPWKLQENSWQHWTRVLSTCPEQTQMGSQQTVNLNTSLPWAGVLSRVGNQTLDRRESNTWHVIRQRVLWSRTKQGVGHSPQKDGLQFWTERSGKDSLGKLTFALITSKPQHWDRRWRLRGTGESSSHGEPACWTGPGRRTRRWPPLKSRSRFHTVRTFSHHGAPRGARRPVGTLLE